MENGSEAIKIAVTVILVLLAAAIGFNIYKSSKQTADSANGQITSMNQTITESQYTTYESSSLLGSQVQTAITSFSGDYIAIQYEAANNTKQHVNYSVTPTTTTVLSSDPIDNTNVLQGMNKKTSTYYINPNQSYTGKIIRSEQGIVGIIFTKN